MMIAVDFDGTCVTHDFPEIGKDIGAIRVLKKLTEKKHKLILNTIRSGDTLDEAVKWFKDNDIPLFGANRNPIQWKFSKSNKVYAHLYIDDAALGCPLKYDELLSPSPFVDWPEVEKLLIEKAIL